jgi:hypothetical protein
MAVANLKNNALNDIESIKQNGAEAAILTPGITEHKETESGHKKTRQKIPGILREHYRHCA